MSRHTYLCPLRWADMDPFGHVNNTQFVAYLEQARVDLFFHRAAREGVATMSEGTVVARHEIDYIRPVRYRHRPVRIDLWCSKLAGASFTVDYEVFDGTDDDSGSGDGGSEWLAARARSLLVPYNLEAGRPRRLSPGERDFLQRYLEDGPE